MEKRIDLERRGKPPGQVVELNLDNSRSTQIEGLTSDYSALETLSLISVGLTSLKGFPALPKLRRLELSENRLSSGLETLKDCKNLTHLNLSNNKIKDIQTLQPLTEFKSLTHLDLFNNEVCKTENYRETVFKLMTNLKFLDGYDQEENEAEESDIEEGIEKGINGVSSHGDEEEEDDEDDEEDEDDDDDEEDGEEEESEEEEDDGPGLSAIYNLSEIYNDKLGEDDDGDYSGEEEEAEDDDDLDEEEEEDNEESEEPKDKRRKVEDEDEKGGGGGGKDVPK